MTKKLSELKIKVSPLFILMAVFVLVINRIEVFVFYAVSIILHETAHSITAKKLGYKLHVMKFMPYGVAIEGEFNSMPAIDEIIVAITGPLSNLIVCLLLSALWWYFPVVHEYTKQLFTVNFSLAVVNLLPIYPLDGGRIALAITSAKIGRTHAYKRIKTVGITLGIGILILALVGIFVSPNPTMLAFGAFIVLSSAFDGVGKYESLYLISSRVKRIKKGLTIREIIIDHNAKLKQLREKLSADYYSRFIVVNDNLKPIARISETELEKFEAVNYDKKLSEIYSNKDKNEHNLVE